MFDLELQWWAYYVRAAQAIRDDHEQAREQLRSAGKGRGRTGGR